MGRFFLLAVLPLLVSGFTIQLQPRANECFYETLEQNRHVEFSYDVTDSENPVRATIGSPRGTGHDLYEDTRTEGEHKFRTMEAGQYMFCITNDNPSGVRTVAFTIQQNTPSKSPEDFATVEHITSVDETLTKLISSLQGVKDQQYHMKNRETRHRATAESTNARTLWWSLLELFSVVLISGCQIYYIRSLFGTSQLSV